MAYTGANRLQRGLPCPSFPKSKPCVAGWSRRCRASGSCWPRANRPDLRWPLPERFAERLTGRRVLALRRRSKYLLVDLDGGETLLIHLGMSGRMLVSGLVLGGFHHDHPAPDKHDHVILDLDGGARVTFNDARRFGAMDLLPTASEDSHWLLRDLGPEPLGNRFDETYLASRLKGRRSPIKTALLDQKIVAGLGNIYVSEALHRAGISPLRLAGRVAACPPRGAGRGDPRRAGRGDRRRRLVAARPSPDDGRARLFPACLPRLRSRGRSPARRPAAAVPSAVPCNRAGPVSSARSASARH